RIPPAIADESLGRQAETRELQLDAGDPVEEVVPLTHRMRTTRPQFSETPGRSTAAGRSAPGGVGSPSGPSGGRSGRHPVTAWRTGRSGPWRPRRRTGSADRAASGRPAT